MVLPGLLLAACSPIRLLRPGQRLLSKLEIKGVDQADEERLRALAQQKPNTNWPLPKLAIYQLGYTFYDSTKIQKKMERIRTTYNKRMEEAGTDSAKLGRLLARRERLIKRKQLALDKGNAIMRLGEPPVVYNPALTQRTVEQMTTFLHSEGFFRAQVQATDTARTKRGLWRGFLYGVGLRNERPRRDSTGAIRPHRRVTVTYTINENRPFLISRLTQTIPDSGVAQVLRQHQRETLLRTGERYQESLIGQERVRLETVLKNAGYYDFRQQYITLEADTSFTPFTVRLRTLIANPSEESGHRKYSLRQVSMVTDAGTLGTLNPLPGDTVRRAGQPGAPLPRLSIRTDTTLTDSVHFAAFKQKFSTKLLARKISLRPGQLYSLQRTQQTQRLLADLDMFRFNTVSYRKVEGSASADSSATVPNTGQLDAIISATPLEKFQETTEFGGTFVANIPGPFINLRLKTRNPFGGAEVLEVGVRAGLEGQFNPVGGAPNTDTYSVQFGATAALVLPQFLLPFRSSRFLSRYNPKTRFTLSETYVNRTLFTRTNLEFTYDYIWQKSAFHQYVFSPVVINVINAARVSDAYRKRLYELRDEGFPLYRSFVELYEPSMAFTSLYNSNDFNQTRNAQYFRVTAEVGGLTRNLYKDASWFNLDVYQFARLSVDYRRYYRLTPRTYFAYRLNGGVVSALAYSEVTSTDSNNVEFKEYKRAVPYDKYFFAGGGSSVRAWQPRRLGTGSYATRIAATGERDRLTEQPGELLLEGSVEYRFPVYSFVKGAVFTDFGNVWTLQAGGQEAARFSLSNLGVAVGSGVGIRFDFSFLILRLDMAAKVYDPTALDGRRWVLDKLYTERNYGLAFNLGIGYPF
ncbi:BamA/TamA family outer membrane protein [Hymenobacter saemangeumensis]|uniref:BamA/TamA family outer membrane protein n=1 Tax=Hymenobacter saemangeumensis TaxID=1084522 RepID=A0ABP8IG49_9BACT